MKVYNYYYIKQFRDFLSYFTLKLTMLKIFINIICQEILLFKKRCSGNADRYASSLDMVKPEIQVEVQS